MTDENASKVDEPKVVNTYVPAIDHPLTTRRENILVLIAMWTISIAIHVGLFYVVACIVDWRVAELELKISWGTELTGFGMFNEVYDDGELPAPEDALNDEEPIAEDENPFEDDAPETEPDLDADAIEAPPEPEEIVEPDPALSPDPERAKYDLSRDKARLAKVREDVQGMPNLHVMAPGNAKLIVLIRNDRIPGSPFEQSVRKLLKSFPDYRFTLGTSDIDPVTDINALLIATADPSLYAETFLVVSHKIPNDAIKKAVLDSFPTEIKWGTYEGRPIATPNANDGRYNPRSGIYKRSVYLPDDHTVLFLKPEVLPTLSLPHVDAVIHTRDADADTPEKAQSFLQSLGSITTSDSPSMPLLFMAVQGINSLKFGSRFPDFTAPSAIQASLSTDRNPRINLVATFVKAEDAKQFTEVWPDIVRASGSLGIPGLAAILNGLFLTQEDTQVLVTGELNGTMISLILMFASSQLNKA